jgi:hypothetical protein
LILSLIRFPCLRAFMPRTLIWPLSGSKRVDRIDKKVVFPAPFGPRMPKIRPSSMSKSIPRRTSLRDPQNQPDRNDFHKPLTLTASANTDSLYGNSIEYTAKCAKLPMGNPLYRRIRFGDFSLFSIHSGTTSPFKEKPISITQSSLALDWHKGC